MARLLKRPVVVLLAALARAVLRRYRPTIVAVAGSVGKTTTRQAIATALAGSVTVWQAHGSLNSEVGTPLAIFGLAEAPVGAGGWLRVVGRGLSLLVRRVPYPELLVLEFGEDRPGDIAWLARLAPPTVGVVTSIAPAHLSFFKTVEAVQDEMRALVRALPADGFAVLNADDPRVRQLQAETTATAALVGFGQASEVRASDIVLELPRRRIDASAPRDAQRLSVQVLFQGQKHALRLNGFVAPHQVFSALVALAVARAFDIEVEVTLERLAKLAPQPGRMRLLVGRNNSWILDDSYNASPVAVHAALDVLAKFPAVKRRLVVLGVMSELGPLAEAAHEEVGRSVADVAGQAVFVATPGVDCADPAERYRAAAEAAGLAPSNSTIVPDAAAAGLWLVENLRAGDVVLVKGSQVARLEKAVAPALAEPARAAELLCRQGAFWQGR